MKKRFFVSIAACGFFGALFLGLSGMHGERDANEELARWSNGLREIREELANQTLAIDDLGWHVRDLAFLIRSANRRGQLLRGEEVSLRGTTLGAEDAFAMIAREAARLQREVQNRIDRIEEPEEMEEEQEEEIDQEDE